MRVKHATGSTMATLQLTTYKPNLKDPRVREKISRILDWALPMLGLKEAFHCNTKTLREKFGNYHNPNSLSQYLHANIIREESMSYMPSRNGSDGYSKTYRISHSGFNKLCAMLQGIDKIDPTEHKRDRYRFSVRYAKEKFKDYLEGNKTFLYSDKSYRLCHELQGFKRELKDQIFEGWHDYDISAAMPSIFWNLHQHFQEKLWINDHVKAEMKELKFMKEYIQNKAQIRRELSNRIGIDLDAAKSIINGLFQRMRLSPHWTCSAFELVGYNPIKMHALKADPFIIGLQKDVRRFWALTGKRLNTRRTLDGHPRIEKNLLYFYHERQVLEVVRKYLIGINATYFLEHDGFRTKEPVDLSRIRELVKEQTGFDLTWDEK